LQEGELKINMNTGIFDFGNYSYSDKITVPTNIQDEKLEYVFPINTCLDNELIVLSEQN